jgi:5'-3' exonuclease
MGIPYYFYNVYKKYNKDSSNLTLTRDQIPHVKYLFFDYNSLIHPCARKVMDASESADSNIEDEIIQYTIQYTKSIITLLNAEKVFIMIDGVAPMAKIKQQRERRYRSYFFKRASATESDVVWDTNYITPGTPFMNKLLDNLKSVFSSSNYFISGADEPGEGEHKMMQIIKKLQLVDPSDKICIYGLDADLLMLSMNSKWSDNIFLLRDSGSSGRTLEQITDLDETFTYVNIRELKSCICEEMRNNIKSNTFSSSQLINDYTTLCFLLGNDFLEHIPTLLIRGNGINILQNSYYKVMNRNNGSTLVDACTGQVDLRILKEILGEIANLEKSYYKYKYAAIKCREPFEDSEVIVYLSDSNYINMKAPGAKERYYNYYGICNVDEACYEWLTGIFWTRMYYDGHKHDNWTWSYNHHATPFASDIYSFLTRNWNGIIKRLGENSSLKSSIPTCMKLQLLLVLPRETLMNILTNDNKEKLKRLYRSESEEIKQIFPQKLTIDLIDKEYLWQSKIFFKSTKESVEFLRMFFI